MRLLSVVTVLAAGLVQAEVSQTGAQQPQKRASIQAIACSGNAFSIGNSRFYIRGIDYQPGGSSAMEDPLADQSVCDRDIPEFKKLGVNTIRVYTVDNSKSHDYCMNKLADEGIYVVIDANNPLYSINRYDPGPSYNSVYLQSVFATIDAFSKYDNTLAFFSGNEVINENISSVPAAKYVKAVTRDMRQYIRSRNYRHIPVGYSAADVAQNRMELAHYMNCGTDDERSDFFAFNDYSWCNTNFKTAQWNVKVKNFTDYGIPIFLSEYGCITNGRDFNELGALMSNEMTAVYSGGLMYEYSNEGNGYGIVQLKGNKVEEESQFDKFMSALSKYPAPTGNGGAATTTHSVPCPATDAAWTIDTTLLPAIPQDALRFMKDGAGNGPGLTGSGSQNAGGGSNGQSSTGNATPGSGSSTATPKSDASSHLGPMDKMPFFLSVIVLGSTILGTLLL